MGNLATRTTTTSAPAPALPRNKKRGMPPSAQFKFNRLRMQLERADANREAAFPSHQQAIKMRQGAQADKGWAEKAAHDNGTELSAEALEAYDAEIARTKEYEVEALEDLRVKTVISNDSRTLFGNASAHLGANLNLREVPADGTPEPGMTAKQTVMQLRGDLRDRGKKAKAAKNASPGVEHHMKVLAAELDGLAPLAKPKVVLSGDNFTIRFPVFAINAEPAGGLPVAFDPRPEYVAQHRDEILADARKVIEEHYEDNVTLVLTDDQKRKRLAEIADEVLAIERRECAVIWAAREEGEVIEFRPDTDIRAVLGVDGPPPRQP